MSAAHVCTVALIPPFRFPREVTADISSAASKCSAAVLQILSLGIGDAATSAQGIAFLGRAI
jgi:hypothetical protein